jgi:2,4-dienoyl-CoA reductase-like NADH-dependent reductase (Old Yellow Enzyme family)
MTVGAVTTPDQVNTLLAAGKADLVALARPHLANPYFTLQASAWYQDANQCTGRRSTCRAATRPIATRRAIARSSRT